MFENLMIFQTAGKMAAHAGRRQALLSQNVANADTPGYRAMDLPSFEATLREPRVSADLRVARGSHLQGTTGLTDQVPAFKRSGQADPNGNTVALDQEMMFAVEARRQHDRALAIYRSSLDILRSSIRVR